MSHVDKYLKYKNKYLEIKNQVGGSIADLDLPPTKTISWFTSILKFLNNYKFPELKYYVLLEDVGKRKTYVDNDTRNLIEIAQMIADKYSINIDFILDDMAVSIDCLKKSNQLFTVKLHYDKEQNIYSLINGYK
jgi:hypothetical protein